jgi:hypothetical protein
VAPPVISNLRAANLTPTSATIAWDTNEAANGSVVVFYLPFLTFAGEKSDATLELVHALTVENLLAETDYRARVTSSDNSGNVTTQTVDFVTAGATPTPSSTPAPTPSGSPTPTPTVTVQEGVISWSPPSGGAPTNGYRVDIFDSNNQLVRTITTDGTSVNAGDLPDGENRIIVYANNDGVYEKVSAPGTALVTPQSLWEQLVLWAPWILGALVLAIALAVGFLKYREKKKQPPIPPTPLAPSGPVMGAIPRNPSV